MYKYINASIMGIGSGIMVDFNLPILGACITLVGSSGHNTMIEKTLNKKTNRIKQLESLMKLDMSDFAY